MIHGVNEVCPNSLCICHHERTLSSMRFNSLPNVLSRFRSPTSTSSLSHSATSSIHVHVPSTQLLAHIRTRPTHTLPHTCFHSIIIAGIFNMACLLISNRPLSVLSHAFPLTFCPSPVPLTINPVSILLASFSPGFLIVQGSKSTTPCSAANLTRSACLRRPNVGPCQRPVVKFFEGRNGLG
jgi:hypothetical protein